MTEPSPNAAAAQNPDIDPAITNGLAQQASTEQPADVEMTDSGAVAAVSLYPMSFEAWRHNLSLAHTTHTIYLAVDRFAPTTNTRRPRARARHPSHSTITQPSCSVWANVRTRRR